MFYEAKNADYTPSRGVHKTNDTYPMFHFFQSLGNNSV